MPLTGCSGRIDVTICEEQATSTSEVVRRFARLAGMPFPQNLETAQRVEATVRQHGATPATIAILSGKICIGLVSEQLRKLAKAGTNCAKVSRRDIAPVMARRADGATTVAATMLLAHAAGVRVFATGGIGGVHRGAEASFDVSTDLTELGRTPVAVVCAGVKSVWSCYTARDQRSTGCCGVSRTVSRTEVNTPFRPRTEHPEALRSTQRHQRAMIWTRTSRDWRR